MRTRSTCIVLQWCCRRPSLAPLSYPWTAGHSSPPIQWPLQLWLFLELVCSLHWHNRPWLAGKVRLWWFGGSIRQLRCIGQLIRQCISLLPPSCRTMTDWWFWSACWVVSFPHQLGLAFSTVWVRMVDLNYFRHRRGHLFHRPNLLEVSWFGRCRYLRILRCFNRDQRLVVKCLSWYFQISFVFLTTHRHRLCRCNEV